MRRSSNGSSKPYQPLPTRRASFNGGFEADFNIILQSDNIILEQQQAQTSIKKSPRKLPFNSNVLPPSPTQKILLNIQPSPAPLTTIPTFTTPSSGLGTNTIPSTQEQHANLPSNLYKTELCRSFEETGTCRYGSKCQFAHGYPELRPAPRHPKYKTEICKTFHSVGTCPYGTRCRFIHTSPSDNIDWITADVDNPLFDLHDKNAPEFDRSPNTIPSVPVYQSFMARLPPTPHRYHQQHQQQAHAGYSFQVNNNEPLLSVIRAEIPPRLEPTRVESRTLIIERPSTTPATRPISVSVTPPVATSINTTPTSTSNISNTSSTNSSSNISSNTTTATTSTGSNISTVNISAATMNLAAALTAAAAAITPPLPISSNAAVPTTSTISTAANNNNAVNSKSLPSPPISNSTTSNASLSLPVPTINAPTATSTSALTPGHKHRLPVFRELCHQNSVERLQQQVLDFVFEKEQ